MTADEKRRAPDIGDLMARLRSVTKEDDVEALCDEAAYALNWQAAQQAQVQVQVSEEVNYKQDRLFDSTYISGLKHGYNLGLFENEEELQRCINNRLKQRRPEHRAAIQGVNNGS